MQILFDETRVSKVVGQIIRLLEQADTKDQKW